MSSSFAKEMWGTCYLPLLENVDSSNSHRFSFDRALRAGGPSDIREFNLLMNFIRLVDATIYDYNLALETWDELIEKRAQHPDLFLQDYVFKIIQFLENHVVALHRSIVFAKTLEGKELNGTVFKINRNIINKSDEARIRNFRHTVQHWDERVTGVAGNIRKPKKLSTRIRRLFCNNNFKPKPVVNEGVPNALVFNENAIEMLDNKIQYIELKKWLEYLYVLAKSSYKL